MKAERKPRPGRRHVHLGERLEAVKDTTLEELRSWLLQEHGIKISIGALWNTLDRMGLRFKKKRARH